MPLIGDLRYRASRSKLRQTDFENRPTELRNAITSFT